MKTCLRCGRVIKDKKSLERGYGPICYKKVLKEREEDDGSREDE